MGRLTDGEMRAEREVVDLGGQLFVGDGFRDAGGFSADCPMSGLRLPHRSTVRPRPAAAAGRQRPLAPVQQHCSPPHCGRSGPPLAVRPVLSVVSNPLRRGGSSTTFCLGSAERRTCQRSASSTAIVSRTSRSSRNSTVVIGRFASQPLTADSTPGCSRASPSDLPSGMVIGRMLSRTRVAALRRAAAMALRRSSSRTADQADC